MDRDLAALSLIISGTLLFFCTINIWFSVSVLTLIASVVVAFYVSASGEKREYLKTMDVRIAALEEEQIIRERSGSQKDDIMYAA